MLFRYISEKTIILLSPNITIYNDKIKVVKLAPNLNVTYPNSFNAWLNLHHSSYHMSSKFSFMLSTDFLSFFKQLNVDTPKCFNQANSSKREVNHYTLLKLANYIMRGGNKIHITNRLVHSLHSVSVNNRYEIDINSLSWLNSYSLLSQFVVTNNYYALTSQITFVNYNNLSFNLNGLKHNTSSDIRYKTYSLVNSLKPIFLFYIYKVDKNIYKNSRGKSGKFTFLWKYISPFKRNKLILHWLSKELINTSGKTLNDRIINLFKNYLLNPTSTFISKIRRFTHNYVFNNCRSTLASTYKTTTR